MARQDNHSGSPAYLPRNWRVMTAAGITTVGLACGLVQPALAELFKTAQPAKRPSTTAAKSIPEDNGFAATIRRLMTDSRRAAEQGDYTKAVQLAERAAKISEAAAQVLGPSTSCSPQETSRFLAEMRALQSGTPANIASSSPRTPAAPTSKPAAPVAGSALASGQSRSAPVVAKSTAPVTTPSAPKSAPTTSAPNGAMAGTQSFAPNRRPASTQTVAPQSIAASKSPANNPVAAKPAPSAAVPPAPSPALPKAPQQPSIASAPQSSGPSLFGNTTPAAGAGVAKLDSRQPAGSNTAAWKSRTKSNAPATSKKGLSESQALLAQSRQAVKAGKMDQALELAEQAVQKSPSPSLFGPGDRTGASDEATAWRDSLIAKMENAGPRDADVFERPIHVAPSRRRTSPSPSSIAASSKVDTPVEQAFAEKTSPDLPSPVAAAAATETPAETTAAAPVHDTVNDALWTEELPPAPAPKTIPGRDPNKFSRSVISRSGEWVDADAQPVAPDTFPSRAALDSEPSDVASSEQAATQSAEDVPTEELPEIAVHDAANSMPSAEEAVSEDTVVADSVVTEMPATESIDAVDQPGPELIQTPSEPIVRTPFRLRDRSNPPRIPNPEAEASLDPTNETVQVKAADQIPMDPSEAEIAPEATVESEVAMESDSLPDQAMTETSDSTPPTAPRPPLRLRGSIRQSNVEHSDLTQATASTEDAANTANPDEAATVTLALEQEEVAPPASEPEVAVPARQPLRLRGKIQQVGGEVPGVQSKPTAAEESGVNTAPSATKSKPQAERWDADDAVDGNSNSAKSADAQTTDSADSAGSDYPVQRFPVQRVLQLRERIESASSLNPGHPSPQKPTEEPTATAKSTTRTESTKPQPTAQQDPPSQPSKVTLRSRTENGESTAESAPRRGVIKLRERTRMKFDESAESQAQNSTRVSQTVVPRTPVTAQSEATMWKSIDSTSAQHNSPASTRDAQQPLLSPPISQAGFETAEVAKSGLDNTSFHPDTTSLDQADDHSTVTMGIDDAPLPPEPSEKDPWYEDESHPNSKSHKADIVVHKSSFATIDRLAESLRLPVSTVISLLGAAGVAFFGISLLALRAALRRRHSA